MEIIIAIVGSSAFTALVNGIIEIVKNKTGRQSKQNKAVMYSLLYCLQAYGEKLKEKDHISLVEYKQFVEMFTTYKENGGDGFADIIKSEVDAIPRR